MLQIRKDLCLGCGLCIENCSLQAISLLWGCAEIDQSRCNQCLICLGICPQGAIAEMVPVSKNELETEVVSLKQKTNDLIERIEKLKHQKGSWSKAVGRN
jgi:ferredoxin